MSKPAVTDAMLVAACKSFFGETWSFAEAETMRNALLAAEDAEPAQTPETVAVDLNVEESGILCHLMMSNDLFRDWVLGRKITRSASSYLYKIEQHVVLRRWLVLYEKLGKANNRAMGKKHD